MDSAISSPRDTSESSDSMMIFPITDLDYDGDIDSPDSPSPRDSETFSPHTETSEDEGYGEIPVMTLKQRRVSRAFPLANMGAPPRKMAVGIGIALWKTAFAKIKSMKLKDPWAHFNIQDYPAERVTRHRYSSTRRKWVIDEIEVKMEKKPFSRGALRQCFRLKKLPSFSKSRDWNKSSNYVAKRYLEDVERDVYFQDVNLQMDAKLWGEEYNRHNPPKKIDIFQVCIIEFKDRRGTPLYHLEHFIEGKYIKYNSNSGYVEESFRLTPQAFSHFTFERSGHQLMVVDIQGVGDLYTDPSIHTAEGTLYGDGNLGAKGMALFFHSHVCNSICKSLGLSQFDLALSEVNFQKEFIKRTSSNEGAAKTCIRGCEEMISSPRPSSASSGFGTSWSATFSFSIDMPMGHINRRHRTTSSCSISSLGSQGSDDDYGISPRSPSMAHRLRSDSLLSRSLNDDEFHSLHTGLPPAPGNDCPLSERNDNRDRRRRFTSGESNSSLDGARRSVRTRNADSDSLVEDEHERQHYLFNHRPRPSCAHVEEHEIKMQEEHHLCTSILGEVHHELAKYHTVGKFREMVGGDETDWEAALFHEKLAAKLGVLEAVVTLAKVYLGLPRDVLEDYTLPDHEDNMDTGFDYMMLAARAGDRAAMVYVAKAFESGDNLGSRCQDCSEAFYWYSKAIDTTSVDDSGCFDSTMEDPKYTLLARQAALLEAGSVELEPDPGKAAALYNEAGDLATAAAKGRLASKYYMKAEELWALCDEE